MSKIFKFLVASIVLVAISTTQTQAGLIRVLFDDLTTDNSDVMPGNAFTITRQINSISGLVIFNTVDGTITLNNNSSISLTYAVTGGNFGDVFATSGSSTSSFDGFALNMTRNVGVGQTSLSISVPGFPLLTNLSLHNGFNDFRNSALPTTTEVTFIIANNRPGKAPQGSLVINGFYAVPEPSALIMVSPFILGLGLVRRRKMTK